MSQLGGHRIVGTSIPEGKLKQAAKIETLAESAFIFSYERSNVSVSSGTQTFQVNVTTGPSLSIKAYGIVVSTNLWEAVPEYSNVEILDANRDDILSSNSRAIWGRVISVSGTTNNWTYTIGVYDDADQTNPSPASVNLPVSVLPLVALPLRKGLPDINQLELKTASTGTNSVNNNDIIALDNRLDSIESQGIPVYNETPSGVKAPGNYNFSLANNPILSSIELFAYGLALTRTIHYNVSGSTLTYTVGHEPGASDIHRINYRY